MLLLSPILKEEIFPAVKISKSQNLKSYIAMAMAMHCPIWRHLAPATRVMRRPVDMDTQSRTRRGGGVAERGNHES